jgi:AmmeMemoRadiSam system protein A
MHPLVQLAREAIVAFVKEGKVIDPPAGLPAEAEGRAGVFVSLHDKEGQLRGCVGTLEPTQSTVACEVIHSAINAATADPRFLPVQPSELDGLDIHVDVLTPMEPIDGPEQLDPKRYGVLVTSGLRRGLLLPDLAGVETVEDQLAIARRKAGIRPHEKVELYRFEVRRYV